MERDDFSPAVVKRGQEILDQALDASPTDEIKIDEFSVKAVQDGQKILDQALDASEKKKSQVRASGKFSTLRRQKLARGR